jgi:hypothetical protein
MQTNNKDFSAFLGGLAIILGVLTLSIEMFALYKIQIEFYSRGLVLNYYIHYRNPVLFIALILPLAVMLYGFGLVRKAKRQPSETDQQNNSFV